MAFVTIARSCAVEIRLTLAGQRIALTLGFQHATGINAGNLQSLADFLAGWWGASLRTASGQNMSLREVYARDVSTVDGPAATSLINTGVAGNMTTGIQIPNNAAICVSFRTAGRGRANRGRNYWPSFGAIQMSGTNAITSAYSTILINKYRELLPAMAYDPTPFRWVVLSRQLDGVTTGRAVPITAVTIVDTVLDSQRRRLPGRGL